MVHGRIYYFGMVLVLMLSTLSAIASDSLNYSGRLVNPNGSPVVGPVDLTLDLAYSNDTSTILCTKSLVAVPLVNGIFHLKLDFTCGSDSLNEVLSNVPAGHSVAIRVTDTTPNPDKVYAFQAFYSVPYAKVAETSKTLSIKGTTAGQILKWDGTEWVVGAAATSSGGTVTDITAGTGLSGGTITTSGTISIASGGVTTTEIANGTIADVDVSATAAIARAKLAGGTPNYVIVNNGAGQMSEVQALGLTQGGTGAVDAIGARLNLGLGAAALAGIGNAAGNVMTASDVPSCLPNEKLQMGVGPSYPWTCVADVDTADATKLPLAGGTMAGNIDMDANKITDLAGPIDDGDAVNKKYVDDKISDQSYWTKSTTDIFYDDGNVGVGIATTPTERLHVAGSVLVENKLRLKDSTTNYVELKAPTNVAATVTFTLPGTNGSTGQVLTTDGAGVLTWSSVATTSTSVGGDLTGTISNAQIASGAIVDGDVSASAAIAQSKISGLTTALAAKEPTITAGTSTQYLRGDKTWQTLNTAVVPESGNQYFTQARVLSTILTGVTPTSGPIAATDSVLAAFGKLQGQINDGGDYLNNTFVMKSGATMTGDLDLNGNKVTGLPVPSVDADAATKKYVDDQLGALNASQWTTSGSNIYYNSGNVGIGSSSPVVKLHVNDPSAPNANATELLRLESGHQAITPGSGGIIKFTNNVAAADVAAIKTYTNGSNDVSLKFQTGYGVGTLADRMTIANNGNVGIGTDQPATKLQVDGSTTVKDGVLYFKKTGVTDNTRIIHEQDGSSINMIFRNAGAAGGFGTGFKFLGGHNNGDQGYNILSLFGSSTATSASVVLGATGTSAIADGSAKLSILGSSASQTAVSIFNHYSTSNPNSYIRFTNVGYGAGGPAVGTYIKHKGIAGSYSADMALGINDGTGPTAELDILTLYRNGNLGVGNSAPAQKLQVKGAVAYETDNSTNYVSIKAPNSLAATYSLILPPALGSNGQVLTTDNTGVLSWSTVATASTSVSGDLSGTIANAQLVANAVGTSEIADGSVTYAKMSLADGDIPEAKVAGLTAALAGKEPSITAGTNLQYWRGDKTWQTLNTTVVPEGTNMYHTSARVMTSVLGGYTVGTALPLATTDTVSEAFGKLEASLTAITTGAQWSKNGTSYYYNGGNVGIGAATPSDLLSVTGTNATIRIDSGFNTGTSQLRFSHTNSTGPTENKTAIIAPSAGAYGRSTGLFFAMNSVHDSTNAAISDSKMAILENGNVGIGLINPTEKLVVNGNVSITGDLKMSGNDSYIWTNGSGTGFTGIWDTANSRVLLYATETTGNVGIGTTAPSEKLQVDGNIHATAYLYSSDKRLKKNIETIKDPLKKVMSLRGVNYEWKKDSKKSLGFIAQEVELIFPEAVRTSQASGMKSVEYGNLVAPLLEAFKESHTKHESRLKLVESENKKLKDENQELKKRLDRLEQLVMRSMASEKKRK